MDVTAALHDGGRNPSSDTRCSRQASSVDGRESRPWFISSGGGAASSQLNGRDRRGAPATSGTAAPSDVNRGGEHGCASLLCRNGVLTRHALYCAELYFLIARLLEADGACPRAAEALKVELIERRMLPAVREWTGATRNISYADMIARHHDVAPDHLARLIAHASRSLDGEGSLLSTRVADADSLATFPSNSSAQEARKLVELLETARRLTHDGQMAKEAHTYLKRSPVESSDSREFTVSLIRGETGGVGIVVDFDGDGNISIGQFQRQLTYSAESMSSGEFARVGDCIIAVNGVDVSRIKARPMAGDVSAGVGHARAVVAAIRGPPGSMVSIRLLRQVKAPTHLDPSGNEAAIVDAIEDIEARSAQAMSEIRSLRSRGVGLRFELTTGACGWASQTRRGASSVSALLHQRQNGVARLRQPAPVVAQGEPGRGAAWRRTFSEVSRLPTQLALSRVQRMHSIAGHHYEEVHCCVFDQTGRLMISGSDDGLVKVWSSRTGRLLNTLRGYVGPIVDVAVSSDNAVVAACAEQEPHIVRAWNMSTAAPAAVLAGHSGIVNALAFDPAYGFLVSVSDDGSARIWDVEKRFAGRPDREEGSEGAAPEVTSGSHHRRSRVVMGEDGLGVDASDIEVHILAHHDERDGGLSRVRFLSMCPTGGFFATGATDGIVRIFQAVHAPARAVAEVVKEIDAETRRLSQIHAGGHGVRIQRTSQQRLLARRTQTCEEGAGAGRSGDVSSLRSRSKASKTDEGESAPAGSGQGRSVTEHARHLGSALIEGAELRPSQVASLEGHTSEVSVVKYDRSGTRILSCGDTDGTARLWRWNEDFTEVDCVVLQASEGEDDGARDAASTDRATENPASPGRDRTRNSRSRRGSARRYCFIDGVWACDDSWVATSQFDAAPQVAYEGDPEHDWKPRVKVWSPKGTLKAVLVRHTHRVNTLSAHPVDCSLLLSAGMDGQVILWDVEAAKPARVFRFGRPLPPNLISGVPTEFGPVAGARDAQQPGAARRVSPAAAPQRHAPSPRARGGARDARTPRSHAALRMRADTHERGAQSPRIASPLERPPPSADADREREEAAVKELQEPAFFLESAFHPAGSMFCLSDTDGRVMLFGSEGEHRYARVPFDQYFEKDYDPVAEDVLHRIIDVNSQRQPHELVRNQRLCNFFMRPYAHQPANVQRDDFPARLTESELDATRLSLTRRNLLSRQLARSSDNDNDAPPTGAITQAAIVGGSRLGRRSRGKRRRGPAEEDAGQADVPGYPPTDSPTRRNRLRRSAAVAALASMSDGSDSSEPEVDDDDDEDFKGPRARSPSSPDEEMGYTSSDASDHGGARRRTRSSRSSIRSSPGGHRRARTARRVTDTPRGSRQRGGSRLRSPRRSRTASRAADRYAFLDDPEWDGTLPSDHETGVQGTSARPVFSGSTLDRAWASEARQWPGIFVPQLGDEVVYLPAGHEQHLKEFPESTAPNILKQARGYSALLCEVCDLQWRCPTHPAATGSPFPSVECELTLRIIASGKSGKQILSPIEWMHPRRGRAGLLRPTVVLRRCADGADFIVLKSRFDRGMEIGWDTGAKCRVLTWVSDHASETTNHESSDTSEPGTLRRKTDAGIVMPQWRYGTVGRLAGTGSGRTTSTWRAVEVSFPQSTVAELHSPWNLFEVPDEEACVDVSITEVAALAHPERQPGIEPSTRRGLLAAVRGVQDMREAAPFVRPVPFDEVAGYNEIIAVRMDLLTIRRRLRCGYYRRLAALEYDANLIQSNCELFNGAGSELHQAGAAMHAALLEQIRTVVAQSPAGETDEGAGRRKQPAHVSHSCSSVDGTNVANGTVELLDLSEADGPTAETTIDGNSAAHPQTARDAMLAVIGRLYGDDPRDLFIEPVDDKEVPDYLTVIREPMDLSTLARRVAAGTCDNISEFKRLLYLIFDNAMLYNGRGTFLYKTAKRLRALAMGYVGVVERGGDKGAVWEGLHERHEVNAQEWLASTLGGSYSTLIADVATSETSSPQAESPTHFSSAHSDSGSEAEWRPRHSAGGARSLRNRPSRAVQARKAKKRRVVSSSSDSEGGDHSSPPRRRARRGR